jgi:hypothetical protein
MATLPREGRLDWIGLRPTRDEPMREVASVVAEAGPAWPGTVTAPGPVAAASAVRP